MTTLLDVRKPRDGVRSMAEQTFGARLKQLREAAGLTQQELADRAGMHRFGVAKLEGDHRQPTWATVQALSRALGVNCLAFEGTAQPPPPEEKPARPKGRPKKVKPAEGEAAPQQQPAKPRRRKKGG